MLHSGNLFIAVTSAPLSKRTVYSKPSTRWVFLFLPQRSHDDRLHCLTRQLHDIVTQSMTFTLVFMEYLDLMGGYLRPYLTEISTALIACILVMAGGEINALLRRLLRNTNFALRTVAFVLINAFGYGLIIVKATPYLSRTLRGLEAGIMFSIVLFCFIFIGLWAQRNRQI